MAYFICILKSTIANKYYIGSSQNPSIRLNYHNTIEKGFSSRYRPWKLVYKKEFETRNEAQAAERKVKSWKFKVMIERIISGYTLI